MGRCAIQIVMGPAGSGKSTYCSAIQQHCATVGGSRGRSVKVGNLDPAAEDETFKYQCAFDVRDLIGVDEVMDELHLGPNGALMYCMEYLLSDGLDWLRDELDSFDDDEYVLLDCPGQLELYTHVPVMRRIIDQLRMWGYESSMVSVFVVDATFVCDPPKFISGSLLSLSAMIAMELPHVNVLSKCDLVDGDRVARVLDVESAVQLWDVEERERERADALLLAHETSLLEGGGGKGAGHEEPMIPLRPNPYDLNETPPPPPAAPESAAGGADADEQTSTASLSQLRIAGARRRRRRDHRLTEAICSLLDDYSMVGFIPLNLTDEDSIDAVLAHVDHAVNYGEDLEVRDGAFDDDVGDVGEGVGAGGFGET